MVTSATCVHKCTSGYEDNTDSGSNGQEYTCEGGTLAATSGNFLTCTPLACTSEVPDDFGMDDACDTLQTDSTCTHGCTAGYSDNNGGVGQQYTCVAGSFDGTALACVANDCSDQLPGGIGVDESACTTFETGSQCGVQCLQGYSDNAEGSDGTETYSCPAGEFSGDVLECVPDDCTANVPSTVGTGDECDSLQTDGTCNHMCTAGYNDNNGNNGQMYACNNGVLSSSTGNLLTCDPADCTSGNVPTGPGMGNTCLGLVSDGECKHECTVGYTDNNNNDGQQYTCVAGSFEGTALECTPNDCSSGIASGDGYGSQCDSLKTDGSCSLTCLEGYTGDGAGIDGGTDFFCPGGTLTPDTTLTCTANDCSEQVPSGPGYSDGCASLVTGGECMHECEEGYSDNNDGFGQQYSCDGGNFVGTALVCKKTDTCATRHPHSIVFSVLSI